MRIFIIVICILMELTGNTQTQRFISHKNIITAKTEKKATPIISFDTIRISLVPTTGQTYKTLIIQPHRGIEGMFACQMLKVNQIANKGGNKIFYYDALQGNEKTDVTITINSDILVSISITLKLSKTEHVQWTFTNIKPTLQLD